MIQSVLEQIAVILNRGGGIIEQLQGGFVVDIAPPHQQRNHQPRGGRTNSRGQLVFGIAHQMNIGFARRIKILATPLHEMRKTFLCAFKAKITGDRALQFPDGNRHTPEAEGLRHAATAAPDKEIGLQAFHRCGGLAQRHNKIGKQIAAQTGECAESQSTDVFDHERDG